MERKTFVAAISVISLLAYGNLAIFVDPRLIVGDGGISDAPLIFWIYTGGRSVFVLPIILALGLEVLVFFARGHFLRHSLAYTSLAIVNVILAAAAYAYRPMI